MDEAFKIADDKPATAPGADEDKHAQETADEQRFYTGHEDIEVSHSSESKLGAHQGIRKFIKGQSEPRFNSSSLCEVLSWGI